MTRRLFIAIDLPQQACWRLGQLLVQPPRGVRPVRTKQMHLTLHFLGDVPEAPQADLPAALERVAHEPFTVSIRGTGVFPPRGRPTVLWAGLDDSAPLAELHAAIGTVVESCGLAIERRPYLPHVTLARLTPAVPRAWTLRFLDDTAALRIDAVPVERFALYHSFRRDGATEHSVAATFPLARLDRRADG